MEFQLQQRTLFLLLRVRLIILDSVWKKAKCRTRNTRTLHKRLVYESATLCAIIDHWYQLLTSREAVSNRVSEVVLTGRS